MNLDFTPEENAFREEVRAYIAQAYPQELRAVQEAHQDLDKDDLLRWHKVLAQKGWVAPAWPAEFGGTDWTATQRYIWVQELARADTFTLMFFGLSMLAPVLFAFGTEEQKQRFLPDIFNGNTWWCQGYSEPGAGSDLASLNTRAERFTDEDGKEYYLVNGQKTWTTLAQFADWGFFLVRTDPTVKPQAGISFLLIDMKSSGVSVRPIITLEGGHEVNDVFLENVRVPIENRVHDENKGWICAKALLAHERTNIAGVAESKRKMEQLIAIASAQYADDGTRLIDDPFFRRKLSELEIDLMALEHTELRTLTDEASGRGPGPESSILKIKGSEIKQRMQALAVEAAGPEGTDLRPNPSLNLKLTTDGASGVLGDYLNGRKYSIFGGSNEIQRNIIAKAVLGL
jgi:alkylation response protein AidB-like acyl-CoA dehydrogenase